MALRRHVIAQRLNDMLGGLRGAFASASAAAWRRTEENGMADAAACCGDATEKCPGGLRGTASVSHLCLLCILWPSCLGGITALLPQLAHMPDFYLYAAREEYHNLSGCLSQNKFICLIITQCMEKKGKRKTKGWRHLKHLSYI